MDDEPMVLLPNGAAVLHCIFQLVMELQARGYQFEVDEGTLAIRPPLHGNAWVLLDTNWRDVACILAAPEGRPH